MWNSSSLKRINAMKIIQSLIISLSLFTKIPVPHISWTKENMKYMIAAFPVAGAVIGILLLSWLKLCEILSFGNILFSAGITIIPILVTGGIHLDGFCDTVDALASNSSLEKRQQIMKDPHAGAFAVIFAIIYLLAYFAIATEIPRHLSMVLSAGLLHIISRSTIGFGVLTFTPSGNSGLFYSLSESADKTRSTKVLYLIFASCCAILIKILGVAAIFIPLSTVLVAVGILQMAKKKFGGMSGDLSGYWLQISELTMLIVLVLIERMIIK